MKTYIRIVGVAFALFIFSPTMGHCISNTLWFSSHTTTTDKDQQPCQKLTPVNFPMDAVLGFVCVNSTAPGTFSVFNSSGIEANTVAVVNIANPGCYNYNVYTSSGLMYSSSGTADITFGYQCY